MRKFPPVSCAMFLLLVFVAPVSHAQIFQPDHGPIQMGIGYQYQHFDVLDTHFHTNGYNTNVAIHVVDWITGASARLTADAEGTAIFGYGGRTSGNPNLHVDSLFIGGGPRFAIQSASRVEPWIHMLVGWQHLRYTQTNVLGSNSALGFMGGLGVDYRLSGRLYWRLQGDYIGTHYQSAIQNNYSAGSGIVFKF